MRATKALHVKAGRTTEHDPSAAAARKLWPLLDGHMGLSFRQHELVGPYRVDFLCPAARLVIRLGTGDDDTDQTAWLQSQDYRVLTFDAADVAYHPETVLDAITDTFKLRVVRGKS